MKRLLIFELLLLLAGCRSTPPAATPTSTLLPATATFAPPTATATPSPQPTRTATPTPAASPTPAAADLVEAHFREWYAAETGESYDKLLSDTTDEEARRYQTGEILEGWLTLKEQYLTSGTFPTVTQTTTDYTVTVALLDDATAVVSQTLLAGYHLRYDATEETWEQVDIPADGRLDGVMYLGTSVYELRFEEGRWKVARALEWIPRP